MALDSSYESVSAARHRFDIARFFSGIGKCTPQLIDGRVETALEIDERALSPELVTQLLARNYITRMSQQEQQNLQRLT